MKRAILLMFVLVGMLSLNVQAQESLSDAVEEAGVEWMVGKWSCLKFWSN